MKRILIYLVVSFPILLFPQQSKLSKAVNYLSGFIASEYFNELQSSNSDLALVDTIYLRAVNYFEVDYSEALLALTFTTVPYNEVPIEGPILKSIFYYPLISASDSIFLKKNEQLPRYLFFDSPATNHGDVDKQAHFYGSAFISYSITIFDLGNLIGYFVEAFEEDFKVQSKIDKRDLDVNLYGKLFGETLEIKPDTLPSHILIIRSLRYFIFSL
jgi:hypothetical protein